MNIIKSKFAVNRKVSDCFYCGYQFSWVSRIINYFSIFFNISPFLSSVIIFGFLPWIPWFLVMFLTSYNKTVFKMLIGSIPYWLTFPVLLAYLWLFIGPFLIHKYETILLPSFFFYSKRFCNSENYLSLLNIASRFPFFSRLFGFILLFLALLMGLIVFPYAKSNFFINNIYHPFYLSSVLLLTLSMVVGAFGVYGVILSLRLVHYFSKLNLFIDVTDPYDKGGYGYIVRFTLKTTVLFASGFAIIPFLYNVSVWISGFGQIIGLLLALIFISLLALSFFVPYFYFSIIIRNNRDKLLKDYLCIIADEIQNLSIKNILLKPTTEYDLRLINWYISRLNDINGLSLDINVILQLVASIGIPTVITIIQYKWM